MILEIKQLIWLQTPKGQGIAKFLIDNGPESDLMWVCFIHDTSEIWTFSNYNVKVSDNITLGRALDKNQSMSFSPAEFAKLNRGTESK